MVSAPPPPPPPPRGMGVSSTPYLTLCRYEVAIPRVGLEGFLLPLPGESLFTTTPQQSELDFSYLCHQVPPDHVLNSFTIQLAWYQFIKCTGVHFEHCLDTLIQWANAISLHSLLYTPNLEATLSVKQGICNLPSNHILPPQTEQ